MPHLLLEYSQRLADDSQIELLLGQLHQSVCATGLFVESHIKLRAYPCQHYLVGGDNAPFIHLQARIKPGRSSENKKLLSETLLAGIRAQPWAAGVITVEIVEMDADSYAKALLV